MNTASSSGSEYRGRYGLKSLPSEAKLEHGQRYRAGECQFRKKQSGRGSDGLLKIQVDYDSSSLGNFNVLGGGSFAQFAQRSSFNLTNSLLGNSQFGSDFLQSQRLLRMVQAEPPNNDLLFTMI